MAPTPEQPDNPPLNDALARFLDGELEPNDHAVIADALANRADFANELDGLLTIDELLRQRSTENDAFVDAVRIYLADSGEGEQFVQSVHEKIAARSDGNAPKRTGGRGFRLPWIIAAMSIAIATLSFWWPRPAIETETGSPVAGVPPATKSGQVDTNDGSAGGSVSRAGSDSDTRALDVPPVWAAVLRKAIDVQWADGTEVLSAGESMTPRRIQFESGLVELQTNRGALIRLEGPADLEVISGMEVRCLAGKLRVDVPPPALGFVVHTPSVKVVDKGTSFAMKVGSELATEVHVIKGMVELVSPTGNAVTRELGEGKSVGVNQGVYRDIPSREEDFPSEELMSSRHRTARRREQKAWERRRAAITDDPDCFVYFDFASPGDLDTVLANLADIPDGASDGTIVGCDWVGGRWPGKQALEFKNDFDRLLVPVAREYASLTCMASVRLDKSNYTPRSLLTIRDAAGGTVRWQISPVANSKSLGRIELKRQSPSGNWLTYESKSLLRPEQLGTWLHLAFVWDSQSGICRQYIDGKLVSTHRIRTTTDDEAVLLFAGQLEIGNSGLGGEGLQLPSGHLRGRMDEFAMLGRVITTQEIRTYQDLNAIVWSGDAVDNRWDQTDNWAAGITPSENDTVYVDLVDSDRAHFSKGDSPNLSAMRIGSASGREGALEISGGTLTANSNSNAHTRVGVAGGKGTVTQRGGSAILNSLQIALDQKSTGLYHLSDGDLLIFREVHGNAGSIDIGAKGGRGTFLISGGALRTRRGVTLGRTGGTGQFSVQGSRPAEIAIGSHLNMDGFWLQHEGSTLQCLIDTQGITPIVIHDVDDKGGGDVTFEAGALLDVGFLGEAQTGSWNLMTWEGELTDHGLEFSDTVDQDIWRFEFVDSNNSGTPDTLRVTASASQ